MNSELDKEIDSLLREGARRGRAVHALRDAQASVREDDGARATLSGAHLDADEQNAYAENSLPSSARTHYAAHLADCDDCRRSVTQLALASGIPAQLEQRAVTTGQEVLSNGKVLSNVTWRERLSRLFAPHALRYVVPALALLLVGAVALMVLMREQPRDVSVAQEQRRQPGLTKTASPEMNHAQQNSDTTAAAVDDEGVAQPELNSNTSIAGREVAAIAREDKEQATAGTILSDDNPPPPPQSSTGAAAATSAPVVAAPMPAPTPLEESVVASDAESKVKRAEPASELARDAQRSGNYETSQQSDHISGPRRNERSRDMQRGATISRDGTNRNDDTSAPRPAERRARQREADAEQAAGASADSASSTRLPKGMPLPGSAAETRTVAGRKFRRAGGAWIDTAYNSSQSVTSVSRNSEQYRALVADEPELRRIANALGGEVTVVWKGRAYRIR